MTEKQKTFLTVEEIAELMCNAEEDVHSRLSLIKMEDLPREYAFTLISLTEKAIMKKAVLKSDYDKLKEELQYKEDRISDLLVERDREHWDKKCISKEKVRKAEVFVEHIENHIKKMCVHDGKVMCKICKKDIDEIYRQHKKQLLGEK